MCVCALLCVLRSKVCLVDEKRRELQSLYGVTLLGGAGQSMGSPRLITSREADDPDNATVCRKKEGFPYRLLWKGKVYRSMP